MFFNCRWRTQITSRAITTQQWRMPSKFISAGHFRAQVSRMFFFKNWFCFINSYLSWYKQVRSLWSQFTRKIFRRLKPGGLHDKNGFRKYRRNCLRRSCRFSAKSKPKQRRNLSRLKIRPSAERKQTVFRSAKRRSSSTVRKPFGKFSLEGRKCKWTKLKTGHQKTVKDASVHIVVFLFPFSLSLSLSHFWFFFQQTHWRRSPWNWLSNQHSFQGPTKKKFFF